ncbi:MAG TPA: GAF domain-containing protein [Polyangiales bacterium]|jgi:hypothetical protein|nr:GAF domain-containing protein [Polyangiales bacterium]
MRSHLSHTLADAVQRFVEAPEHVLSRVAARFSAPPQPAPAVPPTEDHILLRLERVFEALTDLPFRSDVAAAFELACDALQDELPSEALIAGVYDIDADEIRVTSARGAEADLLRGMLLSRERCFLGRTHEEPFVIEAVDWIGSGEPGGQVLLCPIVHDGNLLGVLAMADPLCVAQLGEHDVELVQYIAERLAVFMQALRERPSLPPAPRNGT